MSFFDGSFSSVQCPFCGSLKNEARLFTEEVHGCRGVDIYCRNCGINGPFRDTQKEAKEAWEKRILKEINPT